MSKGEVNRKQRPDKMNRKALVVIDIQNDMTKHCRDIIDRLFSKAGGFPEYVMEIEEDMVIAGLVAKGFGIAVIPDMHILSEMSLKTLTITEPVPERNFYMATLKDIYFAPLVVAFRDFAKTYRYTSRYIF